MSEFDGIEGFNEAYLDVSNHGSGCGIGGGSGGITSEGMGV